MKPSAYIEWKDGRIEPTDSGGGMKILLMHRQTNEERWQQTTFDAARMTDEGLPVYVESSTEDINARVRESEARSMVERAIRNGVALPGYVLKARYPGETDEEMARRVEILRPVVR